MKSPQRAAMACILAVFFCSSAIAQSHHDHGQPGEIRNLGELTFESSGSPAAQPHFIRGLLLLHSFEYVAAARAFREAQKADPAFALAYWGEAMTYNHPIWGQQDAAAARDALSRLGATEDERLARAPTEREKGYLRAVHALFGNGSKKERDAAYAAAMERLATAHPTDLDARAFHALSLLGLTGTERDVANYMKAGALAEEIYEISPRHPGALHYLIHAYDDPLHAPLGLRAARRYARVAPAAAHAQHMPSHIFFPLGMWEESIESNVTSMTTERSNGTGGYHPLYWLHYAYLQQGRRDEAAALVSTVAADLAKAPNSVPARIVMASVCATSLIEIGFDERVPCGADIDRSGITGLEGFIRYEPARALAALRRGDPAGAKAALSRLEEMLRRGREEIGAGDAARRWQQVSPRHIALGEVTAKQVRAAILFEEGKRDDALRLAAEAAAAEEALEFDAGPPPIAKPAAELYADLLMRAERFANARVQYERALQRAPRRTLALAGLVRAATRSGDEARARDALAILQKQWRATKSPVVGGE